MKITARNATLVLSVFAMLAVAAAVNQSATADSGDTEGRAANIEGSILGSGVSVSEVTLPADGGPVDGGASIGESGDIGLEPIASLSIDASSGLVESHCEGSPDGPEVEAYCYTIIHGLDIGLTANAIGDLVEIGAADVLSADTIEVHSTCTFDGDDVSCTSEGTTASSLNVFGDPVTDLDSSPSFDANLLDLVSVEVGINQQGSSSFGPNGLEVVMFEVDIDVLPEVGDESVLNASIGVADTHLSNLQASDEPSIADITPDEGPASGGTDVTITGENFADECSVAFGSVPAASADFVNPLEITAVTPAHAPGAVDVVVSCPDGDSDPGEFTFEDEGDDNDPVIIDIDPDEGSGGTEVTITGRNFVDGCTVTFGGEEAGDITVVSDTEITVLAPEHDPEAVSVVVSCPEADSAPGDFTYADQYGIIVPALAKNVD